MNKIRCPHCGWKRNLLNSRIGDEEIVTDVIRKSNRLSALAKKIKEVLNDPHLDEANAWIDLSCANCENSYQYNVRSKAVRQ